MKDNRAVGNKVALKEAKENSVPIDHVLTQRRTLKIMFMSIDKKIPLSHQSKNRL